MKTFVKNILIVLTALVSYTVEAQQDNIDSLKAIAADEGNPIEQIKALYAWDNLIYLSDPKLDQELNLKIAQLAESELMKASSHTQEEIDFLFDNLTNAYNVLGINSDDAGDYAKALDYYYKAIWISERIGDREKVSSIQNNIGLIHEKMHDYDLAMKFYRKSLHGERQANNLSGQVNALNNIGSVYLSLNEYDSSMYYYQMALSHAEQAKEEYFYVATLANVGVIHERLEQKDSALFYYYLAKPVFEELGDWDGLSNVYFNIGTIYVELGEPKKAIPFCQKGFDIAEEFDAQYRKMINCDCLFNAYELLGNADSTLKYYILSDSIEYRLNNLEAAKEIAQKDLQYQHKVEQFEDSVAFAAEMKEQELESAKKEADGKFKITLLLTGLGFFGLIGFFIYYRLNVTKRQKLEIERQALITQKQKEVIAHQKEEIDQSINYAQLIQEATLPVTKLSDISKDAFLVYLPKDKVSGDFYWLEQEDNKAFYCVADCTGHGIPGAFISMIGTILLNEIFNSKKMRSPEQILDELNRLVQMTLLSHNRQMKDGMDLSFCVLDKNSHQLFYAGANNPLWVISSEEEKISDGTTITPSISVEGKHLFELKADKQPVGKYHEEQQPFTLKSIQLKEGDDFYLFSDGFPDQFGGESYKKYKYKPFKRLLIKTSLLDKGPQKKAIEEEFFEWKDGVEQIDDVCIIGVKV